ncbi:MAG: magnesium transporter [Verrucomicrobiaceae bacterium]|nr:magnesium transporter [Verrucomicrobiaceae bacterium]
MGEGDVTGQLPLDVETILEALQSLSTDRILAIAKEAHPGDVAAAFERLEDLERREILDLLPAEALSAWVDYLPSIDIEKGLATLTRTEQREVLAALSDDELVDLLQEIEEEDLPQYLELLGDHKREISAHLMRYPEETAGGRMTTAMATVREDRTVREALNELAAIQDQTELLSRIYVVDEDRRILGKVRLRDLAFNSRSTLIRDLMDSDQSSVPAMADQEEAAQMIARYDLVALPVVDEDGRLLGVITHDDALDILEEESTEDMERISGIGGQGGLAYLQTPAVAHFRRRFGWILTLAFLALASGFILHAFEGVLKAYYILALYLPMVVAAGGNTGAQSATMVIRAMSLGELDTREFWRVIWKEGRVGIMLGGLLGLCVALQINFLLPASFDTGTVSVLRIGFVVGLSLMAQVVTSTLIGAGLPLLAKKVNLDPAVVASPAITTLVDMSGSVIYFGLAGWLFT